MTNDQIRDIAVELTRKNLEATCLAIAVFSRDEFSERIRHALRQGIITGLRYARDNAQPDTAGQAVQGSAGTPADHGQ